MRKGWLDNLRWMTVLLVLFYHVFYFYNNKGVLGGIGGFDADPMKQPQDIVLYVIYPWIMMLLFLLAGMSARYALERKSVKDYINSRFHKLVIPSVLGPLAYHWITGYFNILVSPAKDDFAQIPVVFRWLIYSGTGGGPLWFLQDLMCFTVILLLLRLLDKEVNFLKKCSRANTPVILLLGVLVYAGSQIMVYNPQVEKPLHAMINTFRPIAYIIPFLLGYFVFSHEEVLQRVKKMWLPVSVCAIVAGVVLCIQQWGNSYASPEFLSHWLTCLYAWLMILAIMGVFMKYFDSKNSFCNYMTRNSFGFYILHYTVVVSFGYLLKMNTSLSPWVIYTALTGIVFCLTPILNEVISRIPIIRWMVLGKRKAYLYSTGHD